MFSEEDLKRVLPPDEIEGVLARLQNIEESRKKIKNIIDHLSSTEEDKLNLEFKRIKEEEKELRQKKLEFYKRNRYSIHVTGERCEGNKRIWQIHPLFSSLRHELGKNRDDYGYSDEALADLPPWAIVEEPDDDYYSLFARKLIDEPERR